MHSAGKSATHGRIQREWSILIFKKKGGKKLTLPEGTRLRGER